MVGRHLIIAVTNFTQKKQTGIQQKRNVLRITHIQPRFILMLKRNSLVSSWTKMKNIKYGLEHKRKVKNSSGKMKVFSTILIGTLANQITPIGQKLALSFILLNCFGIQLLLNGMTLHAAIRTSTFASKLNKAFDPQIQ